MAKNHSLGFTSVKTEGLLLPRELLARVAALDAKLPGTRPEDYHLPPGERINETINRSWNHLSGIWSRFSKELAGRPAGDAATGSTRERWLLPLFQELGYGRLQREKAVEIEGRSYPVSHRWENAPIHLVGVGLDLDKRAPGQAGAAQASPHGMVQAFLNRSDGHLWAFVSNGLKLRILRDNQSLTRQAFVEFDLAAMMDGELYADFRLLWLLCHQSRVESERPEQCWLEKWTQEAQQQGVRALDELQRGVTEAIGELGSGFLAHPANVELQTRLSSGALSAQDYYRQLLRLVYRLIFLFVAEDRDVLLRPDAGDKARQRYRDYYSTARLRRLSGRLKGSRHGDLYEGLKLVMGRLHEQGCPPLALPALGSFLWSPESMPGLAAAKIDNRFFLAAIRALAYTRKNHTLRPVDYRNLGSEELGSVYESLLELHPELHREAATFLLKTAAGNERKTTGSYYTPDSLVQCLLDSALEPVIAEAKQGKGGEAAAVALLKLKICDPAVGSGHFLIAAAHRLAKHVAAARTGEEEPNPEATRTALREVIGHCLYGVDINPMSAELCKISLWLEALEPGKPLTFLDHHIKCGNSLLGATPEAVKAGIPDAAYKPIAGDTKEAANWMKKLNQDAKSGQGNLFDLFEAEPWERLGNLPAAVAKLEGLDDDTPQALAAKEKLYREIVEGAGYDNARLLHDAWCAAFVWPKADIEPGTELTTRHLRDIEANPHKVSPWLKAKIRELAGQYRFFHWHLEYPTVFGLEGEGGFDCVLGNPPWERVNIEAKQFFATIRPDIAEAITSKRRNLLEDLEKEAPEIFQAFQEAQRRAAAEILFYQNSGRYPHLNQARLNTYVLFTEVIASLSSKNGKSGFVVPSGVATDEISRNLFSFLVTSGRLVSLFDFENRLGIFEGVHRGYKFCLLTLHGCDTGRPANLAFFLQTIEDLNEQDNIYSLTAKDLKLLSPISGLCPTFRNKRDRQLVLNMYGRVPPLVSQKQAGRGWCGSDFLIMFRSDDSTHLYKSLDDLDISELNPSSFPILERSGETFVPVWEAKLLHQFDHRFSTYSGLSEDERKKGNTIDVSFGQKNDAWIAIPRYWVPIESVHELLAARGWARKWSLGYRDITNATNERTAIAACLPEGGAAQPLNLFLPESGLHACFWLACMNSFPLDYVAKQRIGGVHLNITTCRQLPIIDPESASNEWQEFIRIRTLELIFTSPALEPFAQDCGYSGPPFRWDESRRFLLRCELDAAFFHLYGIARDDVDYIMETFPIVKRKDEAKHGEYRTQRVILEIYDAMRQAMDTGEPYQTRLDPPPADSRAAHPRREIKTGSLTQIDPAT